MLGLEYKPLDSTLSVKVLLGQDCECLTTVVQCISRLTDNILGSSNHHAHGAFRRDTQYKLDVSILSGY